MMKTLIKTSPELQQNTNKMEEQVMAEEKQQIMYQWIKGDRFGDVVTVAEVQPDKQWLTFDDGTRINPGLVKEYLMQVRNEREVLPVASETPQTEPVQDQTPTVTTNTSSPVEPQVTEPTIMGKMIMKMSKKNVVNVPVQININIPTPDLYAMLAGGMEEEDLNEEIMAVALQQIEIDNLAEYLKENISTFLSEYYS